MGAINYSILLLEKKKEKKSRNKRIKSVFGTYEMDDSGGGQPHGYKNRHELSKSN